MAPAREAPSGNFNPSRGDIDGAKAHRFVGCGRSRGRRGGRGRRAGGERGRPAPDHTATTRLGHSSGETVDPDQALVVIFQENVSFDHYFGTYPQRDQPVGEPAFHASPGTPAVNGLDGALLTEQPQPAPTRRGSTARQAVTCDQDHGYTAEQKAFDMGLMDKFVQYTDARAARRLTRRPPHLVHGLLRRQHGHRAVELRPALRDERQLLRRRTSGPRRRARST